MSWTNQLMAELDPGIFATCAIAPIDLRSARRWASSPTRTTPPGIHLDRGDVLLFFTDGLVEDSTRTFDDGVAEVAAVLSGASVDDL